MGCGCKKKNQPLPVSQPTNITIQVVETQVSSNDITLNNAQEKQVETIVEKLDEFKFLK